MSERPPHTTTDAGSPVGSDEYSLTVGAGGPVLLQDTYLIEKLAHFVRERVPDRVYHVKGGGAFGYFEVTADVTEWTKAAFLNEVGKRTPVLLRFSSVAGEEGYPDSDRDVRGWAMRFYTEQGNYDLVGNNTPVFFVRDPMKFPDFIHSQERMPATGLRSNNMQWDFWTLSPESAHQVTVLMSDRGTPRTWRHMNGYSSDTYMWENAAGKKFWVKYHFKTEQGIENFTDAEAKAMRAEDLDCHRRDLWDAIAREEYPSWRLEMQIMPYEEAADYRFNPFDITKVWPHADYPPMTVGRLVLDRNPENFFAQIVQAGFDVANFVPGIGPSPDRMVLARMFAYGDSSRYRTGPNYAQLPVNQPLSGVHNYNKDGPMRYHHSGNQPVYAPNSYGGPKADPQRFRDPSWFTEAAEIMRAAYEAHPEDDDFVQPGMLYRQVMTQTDRDHLVGNIVAHLSQGVERSMQERAVGDYWTRVDSDLGARIARSLGLKP
ncbi:MULTISPECIES: catalase [Streptomyces]|uniref:Catalase n=1 Tax=Streptomyces malaysiensis TaxID=92644 RepID=A0A2J7Z372_STRMQ|nr:MULTISPECIES: catalase [Streptomyces]AUA16365.1 Bromoperoxidase-catalase [Streptomyces sp. M56]MYX62639.1 catalase [Streptomyces sp. SID8382]PNG94731.1 Catalase [Streptomyces malaysiensis]